MFLFGCCTNSRLQGLDWTTLWTRSQKARASRASSGMKNVYILEVSAGLCIPCFPPVYIRFNLEKRFVYTFLYTDENTTSDCSTDGGKDETRNFLTFFASWFVGCQRRRRRRRRKKQTNIVETNFGRMGRKVIPFRGAHSPSLTIFFFFFFLLLTSTRHKLY